MKKFKEILPTFSEIKERCGAYLLIHKKSGLTYVGSANDLFKRSSYHRLALLGNTHHNKDFQDIYNLNSEIIFKFLFTKTREEAYDEEQRILDKYFDSGILINLARDARASSKGIKLSEETKKKIGLASIGKKHTPEAIAKMKIIATGKKPSKETLIKLRNSHLGKKLSIINKQRISEANKGKIVSEKTRNKLSVANTGKVRSLEVVEKARLNSHYAKPVSCDDVKYVSIAQAARYFKMHESAIKYRINSRNFPRWFYILN